MCNPYLDVGKVLVFVGVAEHAKGGSNAIDILVAFGPSSMCKNLPLLSMLLLQLQYHQHHSQFLLLFVAVVAVAVAFAQ
jgi:hypothetical protein